MQVAWSITAWSITAWLCAAVRTKVVIAQVNNYHQLVRNLWNAYKGRLFFYASNHSWSSKSIASYPEPGYEASKSNKSTMPTAFTQLIVTLTINLRLTFSNLIGPCWYYWTYKVVFTVNNISKRCKLWRERERKTTRIQVGIEPGVFRLLAGRSYYWATGSTAEKWKQICI